MKSETMQILIKEGKTWNVNRTVTDKEEIYRSLSHDMIAKKIHKATYIRSISDRCNYDGTRTITVTYDNDCKRIYTINW